MSIVDLKSAITQNVMDALTKAGNKIEFMPDGAVMDAIRFIEEYGIPNNKHEDYKYCNLEAVIRKEFKTITRQFNAIDNVDAFKLKNSFNVVVLNGTYSSELSDKIPGVEISDLHHAKKAVSKITILADVNKDEMVALNTAFSESGLCLHISESLSKPVHVINVVSSMENVFINPRQLVILEKNVNAVVVESFISKNNKANVFHNHLSEIILGENAVLKSYRIQNEDEKSYQVNTTMVSVNKHANYSTSTYTFGGSLVRNNLNVALDSERCEAHLNGLFIARNNQLIDNHTLVDHKFANCESNELYKGIAKDKSTGIFNGKIFVQKDAQKTNAYQSSKNILMSDDATINTKPQLEIYADDVKCSHGTSTGKVDENALFYLKARGIGEESARKLLLQAFAQEVIDKVEVEELRERITVMFNEVL